MSKLFSRYTGRLLYLGVLLLGASALSAAAAQVLVVDSVTLIDGTGAAPVPAMTVVIEDGRFRDILPAALAGDIDGTHIDGTGKFLIPGLMDMHVHLKGGVKITRDNLRQVSADRKLGLQALHSYLYSGVTSIYDAGNNPDYIFALREDERGHKIVSPRIFATGGIVTKPGSHGSGAGATTVEAWPDARAALDKHIARKPDLL